MSFQSKSNTGDAMLLQKLRDILLEEDRPDIEYLRNAVDNPIEFDRRVAPIIEEKINKIKQNFPKEFGKVVNESIDKRLKESQQEILDIIYPVLGQMIKKYVTHQFQLLKENIDNKVKSTFSAISFIGKIKAKFLGISESDLVLSEFDGPTIEEIYLVEKNSGLLCGSYSRLESEDRDLVAGMLTAIKAFAGDAFRKDNVELEKIDYENFKILIQNYYHYYIAIVFSGSFQTKDKDFFSDIAQSFAEKELTEPFENINDEIVQTLSQKLFTHFSEEISKSAN